MSGGGNTITRAAKVGPWALRKLLEAARSGRVTADASGVVWRHEGVWRRGGNTGKVRVSVPLLARAMERGLLVREGDDYRLTEAGSKELSKSEDE